jgi:hypothetical protein
MPNFQGSGFTMELPEDCMDASSYAFVLPEYNGFSPNLTIRFEPTTDVSDLQAHVNISLDALKANVVDFVMINQVAGKRGPHNGVMSNYEWGAGESRMRIKQYCIMTAGDVPRVYTLTAVDLTSNADQSAPVFNRMMKNFVPNQEQLF